MEYPSDLKPTTTQAFSLPSGRAVSVPKTCPTFVPWRGAVDLDKYGNKAVLDFHGEPAFAEIAILRLLQQAGWSGVWIDTYRKRFLVGIGKEVDLPIERQTVLDSISKSGIGCFDVFAWKNRAILFAESKCASRDRIRLTQLRWLEAALTAGLSPDSFLVVEWSVEKEEPRLRQ